MIRSGLLLILISVSLGSIAQGSPADTSSSIKYFKFYYDNDFFAATDRYYTQGVSLNFILPVFRGSPVFFILPGFRNAPQHFGISLHQNVFTPKSIRYKGGAVYEGERPFAALLYLQHSRYSVKGPSGVLLQTSLSIGVIGPFAKGEETQKGIHEALDNIQPLGWQNQLSSDIMLNYLVKAEKEIAASKYADLRVNAQLRAGTIYTDLAAGLQARTGLLNKYYLLPGLLSPTHGTDRNFHLFLLLNASLSAVGYNATLQGGVFTDNIYELPASSINRLTAQGSVGAVFIYRKFSVEYSHAYLSPEFTGGLGHKWGRCLIAYTF